MKYVEDKRDNEDEVGVYVWRMSPTRPAPAPALEAEMSSNSGDVISFYTHDICLYYIYIYIQFWGAAPPPFQKSSGDQIYPTWTSRFNSMTRFPHQ